MKVKAAWAVHELADQGGPGRTKAYEEIKNGRLKARKIGNRTVVLNEDFQEYLRSLPEMPRDG